jgi:CheY-like chemotaxis protein
MKRILVIDDEELIVDALTTLLQDLGHEVVGVSKPLDGEREATNGHFDLILMDLRMPGKNGAEVTKSIRKIKPDAKILIITAFPSDPLARLALDSGAVSLVKKPFELGKILEFLKG